MMDVVKHAFNKINSEIKNIDAIVLLQPTSPLREGKDIDSAIKFFYKKKADYVASFTKAKPHSWYYKLNKENKFMANRESKNIKKFNNYLKNGSIFIYKSNILKTGKYTKHI